MFEGVIGLPLAIYVGADDGPLVASEEMIESLTGNRRRKNEIQSETDLNKLDF